MLYIRGIKPEFSEWRSFIEHYDIRIIFNLYVNNPVEY